MPLPCCYASPARLRSFLDLVLVRYAWPSGSFRPDDLHGPSGEGTMSDKRDAELILSYMRGLAADRPDARATRARASAFHQVGGALCGCEQYGWNV